MLVEDTTMSRELTLLVVVLDIHTRHLSACKVHTLVVARRILTSWKTIALLVHTLFFG